MFEMHTPGEEVVFIWVEYLREQLSQTAEPAPQEAVECGEPDAKGWTFHPPTTRYGQPVRHFHASALDEARFGVKIASGECFHPPRSGPSEMLQAHVASVKSISQVNWVLATLLRDKRIAKATHNMIAYRFLDEEGVPVVANRRSSDEIATRSDEIQMR